MAGQLPQNDAANGAEVERLTLKQASRVTGLSYATMYQWIRRGQLPAMRFDGEYVVRLADLVAVQRRKHLGAVLPAWRDEPQRVGQRLRALREGAGLTQEALATATGLTHEEISRLEHGAYAPRASTIRRLAQALSSTPEQFVDRTPLGLSTLTTGEAAARLDVPLARVRLWLNDGRLAGTKVSGRWRVPAVAVAELERSGRLRGRSRRWNPRYRD